VDHLGEKPFGLYWDLEKDTAEFVLAAREALDLTQAELASKIGRNRKAIIRYEQGDLLPTAVHLAIKQLLTEPARVFSPTAVDRGRPRRARHHPSPAAQTR
jgi:DNA-binding XRE family transcriptional regulator